MSKNRGQSTSRSERRMGKVSRRFNNKKGIQLVVVPYYNFENKRWMFQKVRRYIQEFKGKAIVHEIIT